MVKYCDLAICDSVNAINAALRQKKYALETELEDEREKNRKLIAQIRRDYENSSKPSSLSPNHKKITNNRERTGKRPGGQPGHQGHRRAKQEATEVKYLEAAPEIVNDPDFKKTDKVISKQLVNVKLVLEVTEFRAHIYRNSKTGETYHAPFPKGVVDDVNYGGSVKAFLYLLNNDCDTSIDKSRKFLSELTNGKLNMLVMTVSLLKSVRFERLDAGLLLTEGVPDEKDTTAVRFIGRLYVQHQWLIKVE